MALKTQEVSVVGSDPCRRPKEVSLVGSVLTLAASTSLYPSTKRHRLSRVLASGQWTRQRAPRQSFKISQIQTNGSELAHPPDQQMTRATQYLKQCTSLRYLLQQRPAKVPPSLVRAKNIVQAWTSKSMAPRHAIFSTRIRSSYMLLHA